MGREIHDDAVAAQKERLKGAFLLNSGQALAMPEIVGRIYRVENAVGKSVSEIESYVDNVTIERIKRNDQLIDINQDLRLEAQDIVLIVGRRADVVSISNKIGPELQSSSGMELVMDTIDVVLKNPQYAKRTLGDIKASTSKLLKQGVFITGIKRGGDPIPLTDDTKVFLGDVITAYGAEQDIKRFIKEGGTPVPESIKTDWVFHGFGLVLGLLIGLIVVRVSGVPITLGAGGGALLSGLLFGWLRTRHQTMGNMPPAASQLLKDLGLAGFVAAVGLQSGLQAIQTIKESGLTLFMIGVVVTIVPLILSMFFARFVLKYDNVAILAGALSGARSANPAFGGVLDKAGNSIPTVPFAITYALANVFLTLLGPFVVALV